MNTCNNGHGIKAVLFDLNGVLVDAREWYKDAFNSTLRKFGYVPISDRDYFDNFDGLSTYKKLDILVERGCHAFIDGKLRKRFYAAKQIITKDIIDKKCRPIERVTDVVERAHSLFEGRIAVVTNCSKDIALYMLTKADLLDKFEVIITKEDAEGKIKPHPWPYLKAQYKFGLGNSNNVALAIDNTERGIMSAIDARCRTWKLRNFDEFHVANFDAILNSYKITI